MDEGLLEKEGTEKKKKVVPTLTGMREQAVKIADEWLAHKSKTFETELVDKLNDAFEEIVLKVMGLRRDRFFTNGKWELDHVNGRQSVLRDEIEARAKVLAREWVAEALEKPIVVTEQMKRAIRNDIRDSANRQIRDLTYSAGHQLANEIIDEVMEDRSGSEAVD